MKKVYLVFVSVDEDGECFERLESVHETLEGANDRFNQVKFNETIEAIKELGGDLNLYWDELKKQGFVRKEFWAEDGLREYTLLTPTDYTLTVYTAARDLEA